VFDEARPEAVSQEPSGGAPSGEAPPETAEHGLAPESQPIGGAEEVYAGEVSLDAPDTGEEGDEQPMPASSPRRESSGLRSAAEIGPRASVGVAGRSRRGRRSLAARLAALVALAAVIVALVLLVRSLGTTKHAATVSPPPVVRVLISEGKTRIQIAELAAHAGLKGSYRVASRHSPLLNPSQYGAPHGTPDLEGFLFPATYELDVHAPAGRLVEEQLVAFRENFGAREIARAHALHVTPYQLLTVASMVEREALVPGDRAKIAAVIYNRLGAGMPLGIDATIYYAVELEQNIPTYTHELTESQLHINSPYNTRTHAGLPPTPISNPGDASIMAAAYPAHVSYLYYVAAADGCGEQAFSNTLAEFEANDAAYQAAVAKNSGRPPTCKHK
jgi:UPF0755 protein